MSLSFQQQLREEFDLPTDVAVWVVITHFFVLACPLALIWAVQEYGDLLPRGMASQTLVQLASAIYVGATAFEVAQNSAERWYLTEATRSVADLFFNAFMTLAFCMYTIGFYANIWISSAAVILTLLYPIAYIRNHPSHRGIGGAVVLLATLSLYLVTEDPIVFLFVVGSGLGAWFIMMLMKQRAQCLHGWAAFFFGLAFLPWPWAVVNAAEGEPSSWTFVIGVSIAIAVAAAALSPLLSRMDATPRPYS